jgi:hypothetical protein
VSDKIDLGFWLWLIGFLRAVGDWFGDLGPDKTEPIEQLPPGHPDAEPAPARPKAVLLPHGDDWLKQAMNGR